MDYGPQIEAGCTPRWVELSRTAAGVYVLLLCADANPEIRWILPFNQAKMKAFDAIEEDLEKVPPGAPPLTTCKEWQEPSNSGEKLMSDDRDAGQEPDRPAALLTISSSPKFFSNGIDPTGAYSKELELPAATDIDRAPPAEDAILGMPGFIQPMQVRRAAIGGHF